MADKLSFTTLEEFKRKEPCTKIGSLKPDGGWYKDELVAFCKYNEIPGVSARSTKIQLCYAIARFFDGVGERQQTDVDILKDNATKFASKGCSAKPGNGNTEWRVSDLRLLAKKSGLDVTTKATKKQLCMALAAKFRSLPHVNAGSDKYSNKPISELREMCLALKLRGCKQVKKRETLVSKLMAEELRVQHLPGFFNIFSTIFSPEAPNNKRKISVGEKKEFKGQILKDSINKFSAVLSVMTYFLRRYRRHVCLPIRPMDIVDPYFGQEELCDIELCWTYRSKSVQRSSGTMEWSFGNDEERFWRTVTKWCTARFALVPLYVLGIICNNNEDCNNDRTIYGSEPEDQKTFQLAHHNFIVFDRDLKTLERFEPNGWGSKETVFGKIYGMEALDKVLSSTAKKYGYQYISPEEFCPRIGPQQIETDQNDESREGDPVGFCTYWSFWYADRRMRHPNLDPKVLLDELMADLRSKGTRMKQFIRNFTEHLDEERRRLTKKITSTKDFEEKSRKIMAKVLLNELV